MRLFDANAFIGNDPGADYPPRTAVDLLARLDAVGAVGALVWHISQFSDAVHGNDVLAEAISVSDRLLGCWAILPPQTGELSADGFFDKMRAARIVAIRAFPFKHHYLLRRRVFGEFMDEISRRRIPVLLSLEHGVTWPEVYDFLEEYPEITCILCDIGIWGQDRITWPLLESFPRVYVETSFLSLEAGGIEATVARYGAGRLVFGSGFPKRYPEAAMLDLLHANISEDDKSRIAGGNLRALIEEARI